MSTFAQNNVQQLIIGKAANKTAAGNILSNSNLGEVSVLTSDGKIMTEAQAATATSFKIGVRRGQNIDIVSDVIYKKKIEFIGVKTYQAPTEQLSYIGYNGTSGSIETNDNELYYVRLYLEDLFNRSSSDGKRIKMGVYQSKTSTNQSLIANGIVKSLVQNFSRDAERQIAFEITNAGTRTAVTATAAQSLTFTNGSKLVTASAATASTNLVAGDYVSVGETTVTGVYRVVAKDAAGNLILDIPFQKATITVDPTDDLRIAAATANAAAFGIRLEGVPLDYKLGKIKFKKTRFEAQVDTTEGFGATPITNVTTAKIGRGTYEIVAEMEWFTQGHEGEFFRMGEPLIFDARKDADSAVAGGGYDIIDITFVDDEVVGFQSNVSKKHVSIALPNTTPAYALTSATDDLTDVLEVLAFGSANGALALTN